MVSNDLSLIISRLNSFCMILIVMMHCVINVDVEGGNCFSFFIFNTFTRIAVPLFFVISAYLLFQHYSFRKIVNRTRTVLIPFLLWSLITICVFFFFQHIPYLDKYFNNKFILSITSVLNSIFVKPLNGSLWFLRDLYILVILSPAIYAINRHEKASKIVMIIFFILWIIEPFKFLLESGFFFFLGSWMSLNEKLKIKNVGRGRLLYMYIVLCFVISLYASGGLERILTKVLIISGCVTMYLNLNLFLRNNVFNQLLSKFKKYSFFVYATHLIVCQFIRKILLQIIPIYNILSVVIIYVVTVITTIVVICYLEKILYFISPKVVKILTGSRC